MAVEASVQISNVDTGSKQLHEWRQVRLGSKEWDSDRGKGKGHSYVGRQPLAATKQTGLKGVYVAQTCN